MNQFVLIFIQRKIIHLYFHRVISINERNSVLRTAIENGGQVEWDFAFQQYQINADRSYLYAMCRSLDPTVLSV